MDDAGRWNEAKVWPEMVALLRLYARHKYGSELDGFSLDLRRRTEGAPPHYEPIPADAAGAGGRPGERT